MPDYVFRYEILFKQDVSAEDMFLQMGAKNATTACCEYMVVCQYFMRFPMRLTENLRSRSNYH